VSRLLLVSLLLVAACHEEAEINRRPRHDHQASLVNKASREVLQSIHHAVDLTNKMSSLVSRFEQKNSQSPASFDSLSRASKLIQSLGEGDVSITNNQFRHSIKPVFFNVDKAHQYTMHIDGYLKTSISQKIAIVERVSISIQSDDDQIELVFFEDGAATSTNRMIFYPGNLLKAMTQSNKLDDESIAQIEGLVTLELLPGETRLSSENLRIKGNWVYLQLDQLGVQIDGNQLGLPKATGSLFRRRDNLLLANLLEHGILINLTEEDL